MPATAATDPFSATPRSSASAAARSQRSSPTPPAAARSERSSLTPPAAARSQRLPLTAPAAARSQRSPLTALAALGPMSWGTTYFVTTHYLPPERPLLAGLLRALPAGLLLLALARELPHGRWIGRAAVLGVLNIGLFFALLFLAAERLPGGVAATVGAIQPLLVALLAGPLLGERVARSRL